MATYDILKDFDEGSNPDRMSFSAAACIAVFRRKWPVTYSRKKRKSVSDNTSFVTDLKGLLVIVDDISNVTVSSTKENHISSMSATLKPGLNYISEILPGDYVFCWMAQSKKTIEDVIKNLGNGDPCNNWMDGLKFFGKVAACRKNSTTAGQSGHRNTKFMLTALGFTEYDAKLYFEPYLGLPAFSPAVGFLQYYGTKINELILEAKGDLQSDKIVPLIYRVLLGNGAKPFVLQENHRASEGVDNPNTLILPKEVSSVFGVKTGTKPGGNVGIVDVTNFIHGVQKFSETGNTPESIFVSKIEKTDGSISFTGKKIMGSFLPNLPAFTGAKPVWELLKQFVNTTVNEMFTSLKVGPDGKVAPTLTLRQLPFSSGLISETYTPKDELDPTLRAKERAAKKALESLGGESTVAGMKLIERVREKTQKTGDFNPFDSAAAPPMEQMYDVTRFLELPRWKIHPVFVKTFDIGRSDAMRINFIHVYGEAGAAAGNKNQQQIIRDPPIKDELDVLRSGLRPFMATVPCGPTDVIRHGAGAWMNLLADILMGQELTLTGTLDCHGIQQPISIGDNIEYDGVVAHIEALTHSFFIDMNGNAVFGTQLQLTRGLSAEQAGEDDFALFAGLHAGDMSTFDSFVTRDGTGLTVGKGDSDNLKTAADIDDILDKGSSS